MSILETLFGGLFGNDDYKEETAVEHPCSNCPGNCSIAPGACSVCQPYKEKMIDAIYKVEHKDEIVSQYEVAGTSAQSGAVVCPHCGGHSEDHYVCEYCGSKLQEGSGKIKVASAAEIPNPVLEAQDIIFARFNAVKNFAGADEAYGLVDALSGVETEGLLSSIFNALMGSTSESNELSIGSKMSESEIEEMAKYYDVSVSDYLQGLDNGKYLTMSNKKTAAKAEEEYKNTYSGQSSLLSGITGMSGASGLSGVSGLASAIGLGSMLFGGSSYNYSAARKPAYASYVRPAASANHTVPVNAQTPQHKPSGNAANNQLNQMPPHKPSGSAPNNQSGQMLSHKPSGNSANNQSGQMPQHKPSGNAANNQFSQMPPHKPSGNSMNNPASQVPPHKPSNMNGQQDFGRPPHHNSGNSQGKPEKTPEFRKSGQGTLKVEKQPSKTSQGVLKQAADKAKLQKPDTKR